MTRNAALRSTALAATLVLALAACGVSPAAPRATPQVGYTAAGTWTGTHVGGGGRTLSARYALTDSGGTLGGRVGLSAPGLLQSSYTVTGTRDSGNAATIRIDTGRAVMVTTGTFSGDTFSGSFKTIDGDFLTDAGTVTLTRTP